MATCAILQADSAKALWVNRGLQGFLAPSQAGKTVGLPSACSLQSMWGGTGSGPQFTPVFQPSLFTSVHHMLSNCERPDTDLEQNTQVHPVETHILGGWCEKASA